MIRDSSGLLGRSWETMGTRQEGIPSEDLGLISANPQPGLDLGLFIFPNAEKDWRLHGSNLGPLQFQMQPGRMWWIGLGNLICLALGIKKPR